ncbi:unnamed protein product [Rotaria sp. Silwood2]|nr:unnamed protein product [Rotaria sp. Silwood2]CAF2951374.1 unnamed protein product [Rotaria sp. Silwood2]CAF4433195.1 unnamed protein product [Rotaria sp. Silwood2]
MSVGILFITNVNPSMLSTPFASINDVSYFTMEKEILFSMQIIFRINDIKPSGTSHRLWYIHLTLTSDGDQQLNSLIECIRVEIQGPSALYRLGTLMDYSKALEIYKKTLSNDHPNVATCCNSIGLTYNSMGDYVKALSFCKTALAIFVKNLPPIHPLLATSYNNIGLVYANMKNYSEAVASYKRAVEIGQ